MNEKTRIQIEEMKRQTIGVEVEMNNYKRKCCKNSRRLFRNRQIQIYSRQKRLLHLVSLGHRGQRMEVPKRCKYCRG